MSKEKEILKEVGESPQYRLFEFFLQEHGITLLEGQMHDIIHEVQIYLDATNDKPVVKENLTPEEKAREEAETMISEYANNSHISREYYAEGYLSGYHSRDEEVKELREALREAISLICQGTEYEVEVKPYVDFAAQAKQLLNKQ